MKILTTFYLLLLMCNISFAQNQSLKLGIVCYTQITDTDQQQWIDERFKLRNLGYEPVLDDVIRMSYFDIFGFYISEYLPLKDWARANNVEYEEVFLHSKLNHTYSRETAWLHMDCFGRLEGSSYTPVNGVLKTSNNTTFTDVSRDAYDAGSNVTLNNYVYIGYEEPFADINMEFTSPGNSVVCNFEYYNGTAWADVTVTDSTLNFTRNGLITFIPPADWAITSVNSSRDKYYIRMNFASTTTYPVTDRIYGNDWLNGAGNACRGWELTDAGVVNSGALLYNPDPPDTASAKFPYQARIPFWMHDRFIMNPADVQNIGGEDRYTWANFSAYRIDLAAEAGYHGVMCDDAEANPPMSENLTDFADKTDGRTWEDYELDKFTIIRNYVKESYPNFLVGMNSYYDDIVFLGDFNDTEFVCAVHSPTNGLYGEDTNTRTDYAAYDDYIGPQNTNGTFAHMIYYDYADTIFHEGYDPYPWDRSNRGPISALCLHYIGQNEYTYFDYHGQLGFIYNETDEVILKDGTVLHQYIDPIPALEDVRRWSRYFPAMAVDIGIPDVNGYNGGKRDVKWRTAEEVDQVLRNGAHGDILRRDYTNALVFYRPAQWNSSYAEYATYSISVDLGATYYPIKADGSQDDPIIEIALRAGEGAILMKAPLQVAEIDNNSDNNIMVFPNPSSGEVTISWKLDESVHTINVYDATGHLVKRIDIPSVQNQYRWDGCNQSGCKVEAGVYYIQINGKNKQQLQKLVMIN